MIKDRDNLVDIKLKEDIIKFTMNRLNKKHLRANSFEELQALLITAANSYFNNIRDSKSSALRIGNNGYRKRN